MASPIGHKIFRTAQQYFDNRKKFQGDAVIMNINNKVKSMQILTFISV